MQLTPSDINLIIGIAALGYLLGFLTVVHALLHVRTPQGTSAWVIALISIPFIAVPLYWVLGRRRFQGYVLARQRSDAQADVELPDHQPLMAEHRNQAGNEHEAVIAMEALARMPIAGDNRAELLVDGEQAFSSILSGMAAAQDYVLVQYFIVRDDRLGKRFQQCLIDLARRGVRVYFLADSIGSFSLGRGYLRELRRAGVKASTFRSSRNVFLRLQVNFRNHRKLVVVDGKQGWLGGHNVGDEYLEGLPALGAWRDTSMKLEGPAVLGLQRCFFEDWYWACREQPHLDWHHHAAQGDARALILPTGPADEWESGALMFQQVISAARRRIWIASPYFVPDSAIIYALQLAALRGVEVRILIPARADHRVVYWASFACAQHLRGFKVEVHRYHAGFLHQKVMLVDDRVAAVGTANLDNRSMRLNFEVTAFVAEPDFVSAVESMLLADFAHAKQDPDDVYAQLPAWQRLRARAAYLLAPLL